VPRSPVGGSNHSADEGRVHIRSKLKGGSEAGCIRRPLLKRSLRLVRRYGTKAAFDYLVAEKLFNFAEAASSHPAFARELPRFVAHVRGLFTVEEMRTHLNRIQCEQRDGDAYIRERDEFDEEGEQEEDAMSLESPMAATERARQFAIMAELLTAAELGTS
jgi:hypothetical protein